MFRIGEFSKITQIAASQLRFYDEIGLFEPQHIDQSTNYRYYSTAQLPNLHRILALKELGLSLDQIQRLVMEEVSADEIRGMLLLKKAQVEQDLRSEMTRLRTIEVHLEQIEHNGALAGDGIALKGLPATPFLGFRRTFPNLQIGTECIVETTQLVPSRLPKSKLGHFAALFHGESFNTESADIEIGFLLNTPLKAPLRLGKVYEFTSSILPEVLTAACTVHVGPLDRLFESYAKAGRWIEANGYDLAGSVREIFIVPPKPEHLEEVICELQIPIEHRCGQEKEYAPNLNQ
jgi:DNA-binding transcriptional MerR regulator